MMQVQILRIAKVKIEILLCSQFHWYVIEVKLQSLRHQRDHIHAFISSLLHALFQYGHELEWTTTDRSDFSGLVFCPCHEESWNHLVPHHSSPLCSAIYRGSPLYTSRFEVPRFPTK